MSDPLLKGLATGKRRVPCWCPTMRNSIVDFERRKEVMADPNDPAGNNEAKSLLDEAADKQRITLENGADMLEKLKAEILRLRAATGGGGDNDDLLRQLDELIAAIAEHCAEANSNCERFDLFVAEAKELLESDTGSAPGNAS